MTITRWNMQVLAAVPPPPRGKPGAKTAAGGGSSSMPILFATVVGAVLILSGIVAVFGGNGGTMPPSPPTTVLTEAPPPDAPLVKLFKVEPATVVNGHTDTVRLTWEVDGADTVTIQPGPGSVASSGQLELPAPTGDTTYNLVAKGPGGETPAHVQVTVKEPQCKVVAARGLNLRSGPGTDYDPPIRALPRGTKLDPLTYWPDGYPSGPWIEVRVLKTEEQGWISARRRYVSCNIDPASLPRGTPPATPTPTPTPTPSPTPTDTPTPPPTRDVWGPPVPTLREPNNGLEISCPTGEDVDVTLRWNPVDDASGIAWYDVEVEWYEQEEPSVVWDPSLETVSLRVPGDRAQVIFPARCDISYEWRVRAEDGKGNDGAWSTTWQFRVKPLYESDVTPLQAPTPLGPGSAFENNPDKLNSCVEVVLGWEAASDGPGGSGINGYQVDLQQRKEFSWETILSRYPIRETYEDVSELVSEGYYRWRVWARDRAGNWNKDSKWRYFECPDVTPLSIPIPLSPGTQDPGNPEYDDCPWTLKWTSVSDPSVVRYEVSLEWNPTRQSWEHKNSWYPVYETQLGVSDCSVAVHYRWHVRAQDGAGNWSGWSGYLYLITARPVK